MLSDKPDRADFPCANTEEFKMNTEKDNIESRYKKLFFMVKPVLSGWVKKYLVHPVLMEACLYPLLWIYPFFLHSTIQ